MTRVPTPNLQALDRGLTTAGGVQLSDPTQDVPYIGFLIASPAMAGMIPIWEEFPADPDRGHNIQGFLERYFDWLESEEPFLLTAEPRFGHPQYLPRSVIPLFVCCRIETLQPQDARAAARLAAALGREVDVPGVGRGRVVGIDPKR